MIMKNISPDISKHAALAEIVALLGKNMAFAWKGRIYEDENGNTDYKAVAEELYKDAESAYGNEFDELVSSRALKELLYPQIRFVDENSSDADKQNVNYYGYMKNIEYLRSGASELAAEGQAVSLPGNSIRMALAFVGILPIIIIYPMLQKYFIKGVVVGAVKG